MPDQSEFAQQLLQQGQANLQTKQEGPLSNYSLSDIDLIHAGYSDEEIQQQKQNWQSLHEDYKKQQLLNEADAQLSPAEIEAREFSKSILKPEAQINTAEILKNNPKYNQVHVKQLMHDFAHIDSAEQHAVDLLNLMKNPDKDILLDRNEAREYAKEQGVEWNSDKAVVSKAELDMNINRELLRKEYQQEIAFYTEDHDYTRLNKLAQLASAISGGVGAAELAIMIGTSVLTGAGASAMIAKAGQTLAKAGSIARGVQLARRMELAQRTINTYKAAGKELEYANRINRLTKSIESAQAAIKAENFGAKTAFDSYRFARTVTPGVGLMPGEGASLASTAVPFAVDSIVTDVPRELVQKLHNDIFDTGEYTNKDMIRDILIAGGIGAALPYAGAGLKAVSKGVGKSAGATYKMASEIHNKHLEKVQLEQTEAILKNHLSEAEISELQATDFNSHLNDVIKTIQQGNQFTPENLETIEKLSKVNLNDDEMLDMLSDYISVFSTGDTTIKTIPPRTSWMSNADGIYDALSSVEKRGGTIDEAWEAVKTGGTKIKQEGKYVQKNGLHAPDEFSETLDRIKTLYYDATASVKDDTGFLGSRAVKGLTTADSEYVLKNLYIAHLLPNTKLGQEAQQNLLEHYKNIENLSNQIKRTVDTYNQLVQMNKSGTRVSLGRQAHSYTLLDGNTGSLKDAITEIVFELLPKEFKAQYQEIKSLIQTDDLNIAFKGHSDITSPEQAAELGQLRKFIESVDTAIKDIVEGDNSLFIETKSKYYENTGKTIYFEDLKTLPYGRSAETGGAKATRSARLEYLGEQLEEINKNNSELINADKAYEAILPTPEEITKGEREVLDTSEAERFARERNNNALRYERMANNDQSRVERFETYRQNLDFYINDPAKSEVLETFNNIISAFQKSSNAKRTLGLARVMKLGENIKLLNELQNENFGVVRDSIIEKMKASKVFNEIFEGGYKSRLTDKSMTWLLPKYRAEFKKLLNETLSETINKDGKYTTAIGNKFEQYTNEALDSLENYIKTEKEEGVKALVMEHGYSAELSSKEEAAQAIAAQMRKEQIYDEILTPFLDKIAYEIMDRQTLNYAAYQNLLKYTEKIMSNPGQADEILLGEITMTPIVSDGSSLSAENIASLYTEQTQFLAALERSDVTAIRDNIIPDEIAKNKEFVPLKVWAYDTNNFPQIQEAIQERIRFITNQMTEEEAQIYNKTSNNRAGRVATEFVNIMAGLKNQLYNVGSNKNKLINFYDPTKMKDLQYYLQKDMFNSKLARSMQYYSNFENEDYAGISSALKKLVTPLSKHKSDMAYQNAVLDAFEKLDLNKQFGNRSKINFNEWRDALLSTDNDGLEKLVEKKANEFVNSSKKKSREIYNEGKAKAIKEANIAYSRIADKLMGIPGEDIGLIRRLQGDIHLNPDIANTSFYSKYVEDIQQKLFYKNAECEKEDLKILGFDNIKSLFENNVGTAKKAYAVLSKFGAEPFDFINMAKEITKGYAETIAPIKHGVENATKLKEKLTAGWERAVDFNLHNVCGTYTIPANIFQKWTQIVLRFMSSPMLMNAGFKSFSDYNYQFHYLVNAGLASQADLGARARIEGQLFRCFSQDKEIAQQLFINQMVRTETLYSMMYNASLGSGDIIMRNKVGLNKYAPKILKAEQFTRNYSDIMLNKLALIGPLTDYNRTNAALSTMKAIASISDRTYKDLPKNLQQTLTRFGVSETEWNTIFSKKLVTNTKDYISKVSEKEMSDILDYKMFFPDLVDQLSDNELSALMKQNKLSETKIGIQKYRAYLKDKASLLINTSADEMTSIPKSRIQGALTFNALPNTFQNFFMNTVMQFQSFGAAVNFYQWGRRLAAHATADSSFNHLLFELAGHPSSALSIGQFVAESALVEFFISEMLANVKGTNRYMINDRGEFQGDVAFDKTSSAIGAACGLGNIVVQMTLSMFMKAKGQGGGLSIPVLPAVSRAQQQVARITDALTKKSTEGNRGQAVAGAIGENLADMAGLPNQPFAHAAWAFLIGDSFKKWQYGDRYNAIMTQRAHRGYAPSWLRKMGEEHGIINPGESSLLGRFVE